MHICPSCLYNPIDFYGESCLSQAPNISFPSFFIHSVTTRRFLHFIVPMGESQFAP